MVKLLTLLWNRIRLRRRYRVTDVVAMADELPDFIPAYGAVVVGTLRHPTWIAFDCPCAQHHRIMLNLDNRRRPAWFLQSAKPISLWPSIDAIDHQRHCHYFINKGTVQWVPDQTGSDSTR